MFLIGFAGNTTLFLLPEQEGAISGAIEGPPEHPAQPLLFLADYTVRKVFFTRFSSNLDPSSLSSPYPGLV